MGLWEEVKAMCDEALTGKPVRPQTVREKDEAGYYEAAGLDKQESRRRQVEFYRDCLRETGLEGHPKASKAFSLAAEFSNGSGYTDLLWHLHELAGLLLDDSEGS